MRAERSKVMALIAGAVLVCGAVPAEAEEALIQCPICRTANDPQASYGRKAGATLLRGALNTTFGWTELLLEPVEEANAGGNVLSGISKGIGSAVTRTGAGVGELFTFWVPRKPGSEPLISTCPISRPKSSADDSPSQAYNQH